MTENVGDSATVWDSSGPRASSSLRDPTGVMLSRSDRYQLGDQLGRGGMGEVLSARDTHIGRDVAVKRLLAASPSVEEVSRFLREARIQGRLDHPAIVPIHDLAIDEAGRPFFSMKQLSGVTLYAVIHARDASTAAWTRARLLRAFVDVCLAVEFAHTRGVIHRDLKPNNIVLGEFNDVYVIDWGVARMLGETPASTARDDRARVPTIPPETFAPLPELATAAVTVDERATELGAVLGTPGYMAPEQLRGEIGVGTSADIYALGCILFEVLAGSPLHRGREKLTTTLAGIDAKPSLRAPDAGISPELDAICVRATALEPSARFASARELGEVVQGFLDGDRDLALRRDLARRHVDEARSALAASDDHECRRTAMRAAGHALALDPASAEAAELIAKLLLEPPPELPTAVRDEIAHENAQVARRRARAYVVVTLAMVAALPFLMWLEVRAWKPLAVAYGILGIGLAWSRFTVRNPSPPVYRAWVQAAVTAVFVGIFARLAGPLVVGPAVAAMALAIFQSHPQLRRPWLLFLMFIAAGLGPWGLEELGVLSSSLEIDASGFHFVTPGLGMDPIGGRVGLLVFSLMLLSVTGLVTRSLMQTAHDSQERLALQTWQLRQLMPEITGGAAAAKRQEYGLHSGCRIDRIARNRGVSSRAQ